MGVGGNESHPELKELDKCHKNKRKQTYIYKIKSSPSNCNCTDTIICFGYI